MRNEAFAKLLSLIIPFAISTAAVAQQIEVITWVPPYAIAQAQAAAQADFGVCDAADGLTRVGLQFWTPNPDGTIKYANHEWYTPTDSDVAWWRNWCDVNGIECLLTIYNNTGTWDWNLARSAFDGNRSTFVAALIAEMDRLQLDGIDLDLEGIGSFDSDRAAFDLFVHELWLELDARGKALTIDSFHYIWNAPNHSWWSDWVGEVDNIHAMGYEDLYEGGTGYHQYSYQQNAGIAAGHDGQTVLMGMPSYVASWGTSSGRGSTALAHVQEVRYDLAEPTGLAIWDLQLTQWQDSDLWCEIAALKNSGGSVPRTIEFSDRTWIVKSAESSVVGPGPNYFSDNGPDVWVDESGLLHMSIAFRDGKWYSTEVITEEPLGYGTYTFAFASRIDQLDPNVVLGLFTWDTGAPEYNYREIDIEFAKWGNGADPTNSQYVVQPWDNTGNLVRFSSALDNDYSTHRFTWEENSVQFASLQGSGSQIGPEIFSWSYTGNDVPPEGIDSGNARINLWLYGGQAPQDGQEVEVVVESFTFEEAATPIVDHVAASQSVQSGSLAGQVADTHANGGGVETVTEIESNGNPRKRTSLLEKTFVIPIRRGLPATFFANAWATPSQDGDTFSFSFSTDGSSFAPMFDVSAVTDDDSYQSYVLGPVASSTLWVRLEDTDRSPGNRALDAVSIDHLFVRTEISAEEPPDPPVLSAASGGFDRIDLTWTDVAAEFGYTLERSEDGGISYSEVVTTAADVTGHTDTGLLAETAYSYRVSAFNGGGSAASNVASATTDPAPETQGLHLASLTGEGASGKRWTSVVTASVHSGQHTAESGATIGGNWSDGRSGSCTTGSAGSCTISRSWKPSETSVSFTVTVIAKVGFEYEPTANHVSTSVTVNQGTAGKGSTASELPDRLVLSQNYPNPFNPATRIEFGVPSSGRVTLSVFDVLGTEVRRLVDGPLDAGWHAVMFDGSALSSGLYLAVVRSEGSEVSKTMLLMK